MLERIAEEHGAMVHRLVEDVAGYAILVDVDSNDRLRSLLEPLPITTYVNYEILPLGTMGGHEQHLRALGHEIDFGKGG